MSPGPGRHALDPAAFGTEPWRLVETSYSVEHAGHRETLFAVGNGYLGMRGHPADGTHVQDRGTYLNGFHETWDIQYPEDAVGFARVGQTMLAVPDMTSLDITVDGDRFVLGESNVTDFRRVLDFRSGELEIEATWTTSAERRYRCRWTRLACLDNRHLGRLTMQITALDGAATATVSSGLNLDREPKTRQAANSEGDATTAIEVEHDPRQATKLDGASLRCASIRQVDGAVVATYRTTHSALAVSCAMVHHIDTQAASVVTLTDQAATAEYEVALVPGVSVELTKLVAYHDTVEGFEDTEAKCLRTLSNASTAGSDAIAGQQRRYLDDFWARSDIEIDGNPADQQAMRWNLFALAQATAGASGRGVSAKGVTSAGYDGHYFWDTEIYVVPFLNATTPALARDLLSFRYNMLDAARQRAQEMNEQGALYPWRTIGGPEASAYFLAGTAQYHINSAVGSAIAGYLEWTADEEFASLEATEILIEIARFWMSLGFFADADDSFHIHGVTGPDEYTALVNDNFYTNVMAQADLRYAAGLVERLGKAGAAPNRVPGLQVGEPATWRAAADAMHLPFSVEHQVHAQNDDFLQREPWPQTTPEQHPLLLHFHPLVIYRHQVLKQPDVVMAMYLRGQDFSLDQVRRNFEFYEPLTTGDSSLSSCVQATIAATVGLVDEAAAYLNEALYLDLANTHGNSADGVHIASTGGVWAAVLTGLLGVKAHGEHLRVAPVRLPSTWTGLRSQITYRGAQVHFAHDGSHCTITSPLLEDDTMTVGVGQDIEIPLVPPSTTY